MNVDQVYIQIDDGTDDFVKNPRLLFSFPPQLDESFDKNSGYTPKKWPNPRDL